jgi:tRNA nucleotidyltransferase/poly(A) polymerase
MTQHYLQGRDGRFQGSARTSPPVPSAQDQTATPRDSDPADVPLPAPTALPYDSLHTAATALSTGRVPREPAPATPIALYEVGGYVRDGILGVPSKDIDFTVEAPSYEAMREFLTDAGFTIFLETPEFLTIRARFPKDLTHPALPPQYVGVKNIPTADFVLARRETTYTDGRHPDEVVHGTILDDLARRDFTVNAIARDRDGNYIDPHNGRADLAEGILRAVGNPEDRLREDALRALRAIRFSITKDLTPDSALDEALRSDWLPPLLASVSAERRREELHKAFHTDTLRTLTMVYAMPEAFREAVLTDGLWLKPTLER